MKRSLAVNFTAFCLVLSATPVFAAEDRPPAGPSFAEGPARPFTDFERGTWAVHTSAGYFNELGPFDQEMAFANVGASYYFVDNMSLGLELIGYGVAQPGDDAVAGGPGVVFRHHLVNTERNSFFVDLAGSIFEASEQVPAGGTRFNFVTQFGAGVACDLPGNSHLLLGVRYMHLSNANLDGDDRNPSLNGVAAYIGLLFRL